MTRSLPGWEALQGGIAGEVVLPGSPAFEAMPKPFNARFHDVRPQAIVRCATPRTSPRRSRSRGGTAWRARPAAAAIALPDAPPAVGW
jgi:hypothetical protein